jgi:hypothetical protein
MPSRLLSLLPLLSLVALGCEGSHPSGVAPEVDPGLHLVVAGDARLAGIGEGTACSHGAPAAGDGHRWCAFYRPAPEDPTRTELWVTDVTRAMAGKAAACDGSDPGCLLMTGRLFTEFRFQSYSHPEAHRFEGDTLLFLGPEQPGGKERERFEGLVWAWRPGWAQPRAITTDRGVLCRAGGLSATAICVDRVSDVPRQFDLRAGPVVDRDDSLLPLIERITLDASFAWSAFFSRAGDQFAFSSRRPGEGAETLRVIATEALGLEPPRAIVADGTSWTLSRGGGTVFFMRSLAANGRTGALWSAAFPSGADAQELSPGVFDFQTVGDEGVAFRTDVRGFEGVLQVVPDRRDPARRFALSPDVHAWYPLASGRLTYILRARPGEERGFVGDVERGSICGLESRADITVYGAKLVPNLGLVSWTEPNPSSDGLDLTFLGRPDDCGGKRVLGAGITILEPVGPRGLAFGAQSQIDDRTLTFRHIAVLDDNRPMDELATVILDDVDASNVDHAGDAPEALLLGAADGSAAGKGLYAFGPLGRAPALGKP